MKDLLRIASSYPKGSPERRAILAAVKQAQTTPAIKRATGDLWDKTLFLATVAKESLKVSNEFTDVVQEQDPQLWDDVIGEVDEFSSLLVRLSSAIVNLKQALNKIPF